MPNGMVTTRKNSTKQISPAIAYAMAIQNPQSTSQMMFRMNLSMSTPRWAVPVSCPAPVPLPYLKPGEQHRRRLGHVLHGLLEGFRVVLGRALEPADLLHILPRRRLDVLVGDLFGVRRAQCLDAAAHAPRITGPVNPARAAAPGRR